MCAAAAARVIQKTFRGYRARREMQGYSLDAGTRWVTAIREAQFRQSTKPRARLGASDTAAGSGGSWGRQVEKSTQCKNMTKCSE